MLAECFRWFGWVIMHVGLIASSESWYARDLQRAAGSEFTVRLIGFRELAATIGPLASSAGGPAGGEGFLAGDHDLADFDAVLVRSMPPGSLEQVIFRMDVLGGLESSGVPVLNPPRALEIAIDKYLALARLQRAGLATPSTAIVQTAEQAMEAFALLGGDAVVKPIFGGEGRGITRLNDEAIADRVFRLLEQLGAVIYLQEYLPHHGYDIRILLLGDEHFAIRRHNAADWRTNLSRGGQAEPIEAAAEWVDMARAAADLVGAPMLGVDLLPVADGRVVVLEVNAVPGWRGVQKACGVDVARLVLETMRAYSNRGATPAKGV